MKTTKIISIVVMLFFSNLIFAQQINVTSWTDIRNMQNPCDSISINVGGDMDATYAQGPITVNIVGSTINIDIVKIYGFATQPVSPNIDWDVDVQLGYLPKGTYTINISGKLSTVLYGFMTDTFSINHNFQFLKDTSFCFGDSVKIGGNIPGISNASYLWSNGQTSKNIYASDSGTYFMTATGSNCIVSDTMHVDMSEEILRILGQDSTICLGDSLVLGGGASYYTYLWSNNETSAITKWHFDTLDTVSIWLEVTDSNSCSSYEEINFEVKDCDTLQSGLSEFKGKTVIKIYPNPSTRFFNVESNYEINSLSIRSINGELILKRENINSKKYVNTHYLPKGAYLLEIDDSSAHHFRRLLITD